MQYDPFAASHTQQFYHDSAEYDPYGQSAPLPHSSYDSHPMPYKDEVQPGTTAPAEPHDSPSAPYKNEGALPSDTMANKEFDPFEPPPKSTGDLRIWRHDHHGNLWTKGGRGRCVGRFCCCTIMSAFLVIVSICLILAAFLRPPNIQFSGINTSTAANSVVSTSTTLNASLGIVVTVKNPNYFTIAFRSISVDVTYPINNTRIGGGVENNIVFKSNTKTTFTYPFELLYSQASDPTGQVIIDMATKCGFVPGSAKQQLTVGYNLKLSLRVLSFTVSPPFSGNTKFDCPFSLTDIQPLVSSVPGLSAILGGTSGIS